MISLRIVSDPAAGGAVAAALITELVTRKPAATLGFPTGGSPEPVYDELAQRAEDGLDLSRIRGFLLDEYVGLSAGDPASYREVIRRQVIDRLRLGRGQIIGPDGNAIDLDRAARDYESAIRTSGGIDLQLLGIGTNGHIAFNEPGSPLESRTRVVRLAEQTRSDNARFFGGDLERVPRFALTQGVRTICDASHLVLLAWGEGKADAVARCLEGPLTAEFPASALQVHARVTVIIDEPAASLLSQDRAA